MLFKFTTLPGTSTSLTETVKFECHVVKKIVFLEKGLSPAQTKHLNDC